MKKPLSILALGMICLPAMASKKVAVQPCAAQFTIVEKDKLGNIQQGVQGKNLKWLTDDLQKKYPDVCYAIPDPAVTTVFFITVTPDVYHGTRVVTTSGSSSGTIHDNEGNNATYNGTDQSSVAVPYSFEYGRFMLTVETIGPNDQVTVRHRFEQNGIYRTLYGIPLGGRGHHPEKAIIEDAVKWVHEGGLNDPLQGAQ